MEKTDGRIIKQKKIKNQGDDEKNEREADVEEFDFFDDHVGSQKRGAESGNGAEKLNDAKIEGVAVFGGIMGDKIVGSKSEKIVVKTPNKHGYKVKKNAV